MGIKQTGREGWMDGEIVKRPVPETGWIKGFTAVDEVDEV